MNDQATTQMDPAFADGIAIVAGGSGGIGAQICLSLARAGANVLLTYHSRQAEAERVVAAIRAMGREADAIRLDLGDAQAVTAAVDHARQRFGRLHSLVYAAGPALRMQFISELQPAEWARIINTDVCGCFNLVQAGLPHLKADGGGAYVAVITNAVKRVPARDICSAAPKAAIEMLIRGLAKEEGRNGIRANCVGPGWVDAGLGQSVITNELSSEQFETIRRAIPLRRIGRPEEIAEAVTFLLSSKASYISGQSLAVDGACSCDGGIACFRLARCVHSKAILRHTTPSVVRPLPVGCRLLAPFLSAAVISFLQFLMKDRMIAYSKKTSLLNVQRGGMAAPSVFP